MAHDTTRTRGSRGTPRRATRRAVSVALALLVALAAVWSACGDGESDASTRSGGTSSGGASGAMGSTQLAPAGRDGVSGELAAAPAPSTDAAGKAAESRGVVDAPSGDPQATADLLGRKIVRTGSLELEVTSVAEAYDRVTALAAGAGGYVGEASFFGSGDARSARLVLRVPADRYDRTIVELRALAKDVKSISLQSHDATAEVTDLESTLRNSRAVETQYLQLLNRATAIPDILQLQDRLRAVRLEIDRIEGRVAALGRLTELATVTVQLAPVPVVAKPEPRVDSPREAARAAWDASLDTLRELATVLTAAVVYSWWLLPFAAAVAVLARRALASRRRAPVAVVAQS